jgi:hypothetical protein
MSLTEKMVERKQEMNSSETICVDARQRNERDARMGAE